MAMAEPSCCLYTLTGSARSSWLASVMLVWPCTSSGIADESKLLPVVLHAASPSRLADASSRAEKERRSRLGTNLIRTRPHHRRWPAGGRLPSGRSEETGAGNEGGRTG